LALTLAYSGFAFQSKTSGITASVNAMSKGHKIIMQLTSKDTLAHKALMKSINNILSISPDSKVEVVCHGPGLDILIKSKSLVSEQLTQLVSKGIVFVACEFSMKNMNVEKSMLLPAAGTVPAGVIEIVTKQEEGWSYIKAGF